MTVIMYITLVFVYFSVCLVTHSDFYQLLVKIARLPVCQHKQKARK